MVETYTVQNAMKSGKGSDTYGEEYYVKFVESEDTFPLWFKSDPTGTKIDGEINGSKFNKAKKDYKPVASAPAGKPAWKDNSDGQRQGMAINNAAEYVNTHSSAIVEPSVWAQTVISYAKALYNASDLQAETEASNVTQMFEKEKSDG